MTIEVDINPEEILDEIGYERVLEWLDSVENVESNFMYYIENTYCRVGLDNLDLIKCILMHTNKVYLSDITDFIKNEC